MLAMTHGFGDFVDDIGSALTNVGQYGPIVAQVLRDPALPQVADLISKIHAAIAGTAANAADASGVTADPNAAGIGLEHAVFPLETYLWWLQNPVLGWAAVIGAVAAPMVAAGFIGSALGKRSLRKKLKGA